MAFTLDAMGEQFAGIIDVTIAYRPSKHQVLWSFLIGEQADLAIRIDVLPVPPELMGGDYSSDKAFRERFQTWLNALWLRKDAWLERMINRPRAVAPTAWAVFRPSGKGANRPRAASARSVLTWRKGWESTGFWGDL